MLDLAKGVDHMMKDKTKIIMLRKAYRDFTKIIENHNMGIKHYDPTYIKELERMVFHIENCIEYLDDREKFIIYNEVILGRQGKWYLEYYSPSAYRVRRRYAYQVYLHILEL